MENEIIYGIPVFGKRHNHWLWFPSLYLMRGLPYTVLFLTSIVFYTQLRMDTSFVIMASSWFILPFILRPLLSRLVLSFESKRYWILLSEFIIGLSFFGVSLSIPLKQWFTLSYLFFLIIGVAASMHDIAIERFYKRSANLKRRSAFMGLRAFFYLLSIVIAFTLPLLYIGYVEVVDRLIRTPWIRVFNGLGLLSILLMVYHAVVLPPAYIRSNMPILKGITVKWIKDIEKNVLSRPHYSSQLFFLLCYLIPAIMGLRTIPSFIIDAPSGGGLAFAPQELAFMIGAAGFVAFVIGLVLGFIGVKKYGLCKLKWIMMAMLVAPQALFIYLSFSFNHSLFIATLFVMIYLFSLGFAINLYALALIYITHNRHPTFSYSLGASLMGISFLLSSILIGLIQEYFSYRQVFVFIFISSIISMLSLKSISLDKALDDKFKLFAANRKMKVF